jgi:hypothetical protein
MIRTLAMISLAGFLLAAVCISLAVTLAGPDAIASGAWAWTGHGWNYQWRSDHGASWSGRFSSEDDSHDSKTLPWTGEVLEVDIPADIKVTQAQGTPSLVLKGSKEALDHVVVEGGRIRFDRPGFDEGDLAIELTAPKITRFTVNGAGHLDVEGYRQDNLALRLNGSGDATFHGVAKSVDAAISGEGDADLSGLSVDKADVRVSGSGNAKIGPKTFARIDISGSGDVTLTSRPTRQESHVSGSGQIEQEDGATSEPAAAGGEKT